MSIRIARALTWLAWYARPPVDRWMITAADTLRAKTL